MKEREPKPKSEQISDHEASVFAAELGGEVAELDLHGLDVEDTRRELDKFLNHEFMQGSDAVKIIHGRGEQKLQKTVENFLSGHDLVEYFRGSQDPKQAGAVTYAVLAQKEPEL